MARPDQTPWDGSGAGAGRGGSERAKGGAGSGGTSPFRAIRSALCGRPRGHRREPGRPVPACAPRRAPPPHLTVPRQTAAAARARLRAARPPGSAPPGGSAPGFPAFRRGPGCRADPALGAPLRVSAAAARERVSRAQAPPRPMKARPSLRAANRAPPPPPRRVAAR